MHFLVRLFPHHAALRIVLIDGADRSTLGAQLTLARKFRKIKSAGRNSNQFPKPRTEMISPSSGAYLTENKNKLLKESLCLSFLSVFRKRFLPSFFLSFLILIGEHENQALYTDCLKGIFLIYCVFCQDWHIELQVKLQSSPAGS